MPAAMTAAEIKRELAALADDKQAEVYSRFFKTGPGQYGEGDRFIGVRVPQIRAVAKASRKDIGLDEVGKLIDSPVHEHRIAGVVILVEEIKRADANRQMEIVRTYVSHIDGVNSWDLVDISAPHVLGPELIAGREQRLFDRLATSSNMWHRRIAVLATFHAIRQDQFAWTLELCERYLSDPEDLMHKACGWMLREVGKRDESELRKFLDAHAAEMPRTMLRYSLERLPDDARNNYMNFKARK